MEEQKYFTPSIEDIRVGYEAEIAYLHKDNWLSTKWRTKEETIAIITELLNYNRRIRVPYLSKEQIEAEGWYFTQQIGNTLFFKKKDFELTFNNNYININNFGETDLGYWGQCKDVNTLRYITKLLEA